MNPSKNSLINDIVSPTRKKIKRRGSRLHQIKIKNGLTPNEQKSTRNEESIYKNMSRVELELDFIKLTENDLPKIHN